MKSIVIILFILFPVIATAQNQNMQSIDTEKMMQALQEMQQCMTKVDQEELRKFGQESEKMEARLQALCNRGDRDKAQNEAIKFSKKMMTNPTLIQMKECSEMAKGFVPQGTMEGMDEPFDPSKKHVCDNIN